MRFLSGIKAKGSPPRPPSLPFPPPPLALDHRVITSFGIEASYGDGACGGALVVVELAIKRQHLER